MAAKQVTGGGSNGNRQIEDAKNPAALAFRKEISHEGRRDGDESGFANADQSVADQQFSISMSNGGEQGEAAPENCAKNDNQFTRIAVCQRAYERRGQGVAHQEGAGQVTDLGFADVEFVLD